MPILIETNILFATEAILVNNHEQEAVTLILTLDSVIIVNTESDFIQKVFELDELTGAKDSNGTTVLTLKLNMQKQDPVKVKIEDECVVELDAASKARIADYVKATTGLANFSKNHSLDNMDINISDTSGEESHVDDDEKPNLMFYINLQSRNYFLCLLNLVKMQRQGYNFPIL